MFTGIIEEIGTIRGIKRGNRSVVLEVQAKKVLELSLIHIVVLGEMVPWWNLNGMPCWPWGNG